VVVGCGHRAPSLVAVCRLNALAQSNDQNLWMTLGEAA